MKTDIAAVSLPEPRVFRTGLTGKVKLTGTINSERVKGTLRLRLRNKTLGRCSTKHRFRVKTQARPDPS